MIGILLLAAVIDAAPAARALDATWPIREAIAGGEERVFSIVVPAQTAARLTIVEEGIDLDVTLRLAGSTLPEHGLNMRGGENTIETRYVAISDLPATWNVFVGAALPRAAPGHFTISMQLGPADDRARAIAAARQAYQEASDTSWRGTGDAFVASREMHAKVIEAALANGDRELAAEATYQFARLCDNLGDVPMAIEWQKKALDLFRELGNGDRQSRSLNRLGDYSRKVGEIADGERYFDEALPLARQTRDRLAEADILNNSGLLWLATGRLEEALERLQSAIPLAQELRTANVEAALWNNSAIAWRRLGMMPEAVAAHERALAVVRGSNLPVRRTARGLHLLAAALFANGEIAKAEATVRDALAAHEKAKDDAYMAESLTLLGSIQHASGRSDDAVPLFDRALALLRKAQNRFAQTDVLSAWATLEIDRSRAADALPRLDEALALARQAAARDSEANILYLRARALRDVGRLAEAIESIAQAIALVESTRGEIVRADLRTSYLAAVRRYYDLQVELLQQQGQTADAFAASERARARMLLESLAASASKIRKGVDPALLERERVLKAEINAKDAYRARVVAAEGEKSARAAALTKKIDELLAGWKEVEAKIRASSPEYARLRMPQPVTVEQVQQRLLDAGSALVAYYLGDGRSYVWVVDRSRITVHELPSRANIETLARRYHELLSRELDALSARERESIAKEASALARKIAAAVWKPVAARVRGKRLLLVADGALQYVPFAAIPGAAGQPLIADHEIVYLPSASVLDAIRGGRTTRAAERVAVFADPVFTADDARVSGSRAPLAAPPRAETRGGPYNRLRFSRNEAEAITGMAGKNAFQALDFSAAKQTIAEKPLRNYRIVHFATHGYVNAEQPELSGLVLSLVDRRGAPVDGFLRLHEIYNLELNAELVVLSACRTALGKEVHGEGLIGLTRGFMYAGASRVVSTTWNVDDRASARLMSHFYEAMLGEGKRPAAAMRAAQLSILRQPRWSSPHYWAAFGLHGEWK